MNNPEITLAVIGSARVGKSALMIRFAENIYTEYYLPTKQAVIKVKELHYDYYKQSILVKTWDIGQDEKIKKEVYQQIDGFIIMYDITNSKSFLDLNLYLQDINELGKKDVLKIIVGNKKDKQERQISFEQGKAYADQLQLEFLETSVLSTENMYQPFLYFVKQKINLKNFELNL